MTTVLIVIGIILGILVLAGAIMLIFDMLYYRKKEAEEVKRKVEKAKESINEGERKG